MQLTEEQRVSNQNKRRQRRRLLAGTGALLLAALLAVALVPATVLAQDDPVAQGKPLESRDVRVQVVEGVLESQGGAFYRILYLEAGDTLYVHATRTGGNLDPVLGLANEDYDAALIREAFWGQVDLAIAEGRDPLKALPEIYGSLFVAWDDDGGDGYAAALTYQVPAEGTYQLLISSSPASTTRTFGDYRMTLGLNEPAVLRGEVEPSGEPFAVHDRESSEHRQAVQVIQGELTEQSSPETWMLKALEDGDNLTVYAESPDADFKPVLLLEDFGGKLVASANLAGLEDTALLTYRLTQDVEHYKLVLLGYTDGGEQPEGSYYVAVTVNAPGEALKGAFNRGQPVVKEPTKVDIGVKLQQITDVDQVSENFGAVAELTMRWTDPHLAFSPDSCNCLYEIYTGDSFSSYANVEQVDWPQFTVFNQQGNRWVQNRNVVVNNDGATAYRERFTTDFQAPDFNFTKFPFDSQTLYMRVHSLYPEDTFVFVADEALSGIGDQLGEEEWEVIEAATEITTSEDGESQFALRFVVHRYLQFYIFRIFVPIVLIIIVSWFTFFLKDYGKRVDVAGANLLVFVAFNFTVSGELPRLGYLTFMDAVLIGVFVISAFVVVFNVYLKRLEMADKKERAERIDRFSIWIYPLAYGIGALIAYLLFLH
jgi:hypothetical protein